MEDQQMQSPRNFAARAGRWSARHRKTAIFGWLAFVIVAAVLGGSVGLKTIADEDLSPGESGRAETAIADHFPKNADESVLVQSSKLTARDAGFKAAVADAARRVGAEPGVEDVRTPYDKGGKGQISRDAHSALITFEIRGDDDKAEELVDGPLDATAAAQKANPGFRIEQFGDASADKALSQVFEDDFQKAETTSLPLTLIILLVAFGALVAALVPLFVAGTSVLATIGLLAPVSQLFPMDEAISSVVLLVGLAVGVDYSLFYLRREREERAAGRDKDAALNAAAATSGRAVLISGLTVIIAMAGMLITGSPTFASFGIGTIIVVAVAMVGSVSFLPAMLAALGDRVEKGRIPFLHRLRRPAGESRVWGAVLDRVLRRPIVSAVVATALLLALAVPALGLNLTQSGTDTLPRDIPIMKTYDRMQAAFPGEGNQASVAVQGGDVTSPQVTAAIAELRRQAVASGRMYEPMTVNVSPDKKVASVDIPMAGDGADEESIAALSKLREDIIPATIGPTSAKADVTGQTAQSEDFNQLMSDKAPLVFLFVLSLAFVLLTMTFRSIVIPIKAIVLNLLSVGAAYGLLVLVFQDGRFEDLLGFESIGGIVSWLPMFLFVILFGLSMDYHVFILTRVREAVDKGMSTEDAVSHGIKTTAGVVTSAAIVMVAVFGIFATLQFIDFKMMGVGLAAAILIDATIIRGVLLPAAMKLLGDWNWYLPKSLRWLPRVTHEPASEPARA
jgi:uncharacterized membrane protein YdfJ with MMPL/SSD domain